ncbi:MAG: hypothetical protein PHW22_02945 [Bacilli bacterium]|nr:hypothetical protein [Bacilli bacterium]
MKSKSILGITTGALVFVYALISFILTFSVESDEWGRDTDGNKLFIVLMLIGVIIVIFSIIALVDFHKGKTDSLLAPYCFMIVGIIGFFFFLGNGIDMWINGGDDLVVVNLLTNFASSLLFAILSVYGFVQLKEQYARK